MPLLNFNPLLHKIKINLDEWEIWGKNTILKMTVAPQFNYISIMLPITIPPNILNKYEGMVKQFLWEGKRQRIKMI